MHSFRMDFSMSSGPSACLRKFDTNIASYCRQFDNENRFNCRSKNMATEEDKFRLFLF